MFKNLKHDGADTYLSDNTQSMNSDTTQSIESGSKVLHENKMIIQRRIYKYVI